MISLAVAPFVLIRLLELRSANRRLLTTENAKFLGWLVFLSTFYLWVISGGLEGEANPLLLVAAALGAALGETPALVHRLRGRTRRSGKDG